MKQLSEFSPPDRGRFGLYICLTVVFVVLAIVLSIADGFIARNWSLSSVPGELNRVISWTEIFAHGSGVGLIAIGIFVLAPRARRYLPRVVACALFAGLAATGLKLFFNRVRPLAIHHDLENTIGQYWVGWNRDVNEVYLQKFIYDFQSFPSAHAATAFGFAIGLSWLFPHGRWYFFSIAVLACVQRVTSLAHWTSDVCAGAAIGTIIAGVIVSTKWCHKIYSLIENGRFGKGDGSIFKDSEATNDEVRRRAA